MQSSCANKHTWMHTDRNSFNVKYFTMTDFNLKTRHVTNYTELEPEIQTN